MAGSRRTRRGDGEQQRRADLIEELQSVVSQRGPNVTLLQFCREVDRPTSHIYRDFDSWSDLRDAAGLPPLIVRRRPSLGHTRESLLAALKEAVDQVGENISRVQFSRVTGIGPHPIQRVFGSWRALREAAGYTDSARPGVVRKYTRERLEEMLRQQVREQGPYITLHQFSQLAGVSPTTIDRLVGWTELRLSVGLDLRGSQRAAKYRRMLAGEPLDPRIVEAATGPMGSFAWCRETARWRWKEP